jgi:hypothetical protein
MEKVFIDAIEELDQLIEKSKDKIRKFNLKYGIDNDHSKDQKELIEGYILRQRQTKYLASKFGIEL